MNRINKLIGGFLGFLFAGPVGCFLGILIGHIFDKNFSQPQDSTFKYQNSETQQLFFEVTFLVMGYIAKLEGAVSKNSINNATQIMESMALNEVGRLRAMHLFNQGKQSNFELEIALKRLLIGSYGHHALLKQFLMIQTQAAIENGIISSTKRRELITIYQALGFHGMPFNGFEAFIEESYNRHRQKSRHEYHQQQGTFGNRYHNNDVQPYQILGISEKATPKEIKHAYRRLLNQLHPDKLVSKGLSQKELENAKQKMIDIQKAYETLRRLRKFS